MRRLVSWVLVLGALAWVAYTVAGASWSYVTAQEIVERSLRDASTRHRAAFATGSQASIDALTGFVRAAILLGAARNGIRMAEKDVTVSANSAGMSAAAGWSFPVISYQGYDVLVIPLSVRRSVGMTP